MRLLLRLSVCMYVCMYVSRVARLFVHRRSSNRVSRVPRSVL